MRDVHLVSRSRSDFRWGSCCGNPPQYLNPDDNSGDQSNNRSFRHTSYFQKQHKQPQTTSRPRQNILFFLLAALHRSNIFVPGPSLDHLLQNYPYSASLSRLCLCFEVIPSAGVSLSPAQDSAFPTLCGACNRYLECLYTSTTL